MVHSAILEPDTFEAEYVSVPDEIRAGSNAEKEYLSQYGNREGRVLTPIKSKLHGAAVAVAEQVYSHDLAGPLLKDSIKEVSIFWDHSTGTQCKSRLDAIRQDVGVVIDLKTCTDSRRHQFSSDAIHYGYHRQMAFYRQAAKSCGVDVQACWIIAIEKEPPYGIGVYDMSDEVLEVGEAEIENLVKIYNQCVETDIWPAYKSSVQKLTLPSWYLR